MRAVRLRAQDFIGHSPFEFVTEESRAELITQGMRSESTERPALPTDREAQGWQYLPILLSNSTHRDENGEVLGFRLHHRPDADR